MGHHHHHHTGHSHSHGVDALPHPSTFNKAFGWSIGLNLTFALIEAFYAVLLAGGQAGGQVLTNPHKYFERIQ
jgi:Co/Zn/Cd efflux system component